jgi:lysine 2,3-aminomutase
MDSFLMNEEMADVKASGPWHKTDQEDFYSSLWQDKNAITRFSQVEAALQNIPSVSRAFLSEVEAGLSNVGMSIRLNPYLMSLIDWTQPEADPIRRQFLPMLSELEHDHPCLTVDSLEERDHSPVQGLVHRYPDKVLFLLTTVCPVYCLFCTRSYAIGLDTPLVQKDNIASPQNWAAALDYIRATPKIEDVVISGGDVGRLKASHIRTIGNALLDIKHVRRLRFATKALSVQPMKFLSEPDWLEAILEIVMRGRKLFKDVCIHTHFNHPREITPVVELAMRRLHESGVVVRNQSVLLRGVNDDANTLTKLIKALGRINIHPYYMYLCDMVKGTEHFRLPLHTAQKLEKEVRGTTAGFNTPLFVVDTPGGKRNAHSNEFYNGEYGVSGFISPAVTRYRTFYYFDPLRDLSQKAQRGWHVRNAREAILAKVDVARFDDTRMRAWG